MTVRVPRRRQDTRALIVLKGGAWGQAGVTALANADAHGVHPTRGRVDVEVSASMS